MNKIPSFTINHNKLLRGIYVSRKDEVGGEVITTFDIRMKVPNQEPCLHNGAIHTIEHLAATYLRNDEEWKDRIIYWGPMGCLTGNYLLRPQPRHVVPVRTGWTTETDFRSRTLVCHPAGRRNRGTDEAHL